MQIFRVLGHSRQFQSRDCNVCRELLAENGRRVFFHDLHGKQFNPIIPSSEIVGCYCPHEA